MGARLKFALSLVFDFEVYLVDELTAVGTQPSRRRVKPRLGNSTTPAIMVSRRAFAQGVLQLRIWLHEGQAYWFDEIDEALARYRESLAA